MINVTDFITGVQNITSESELITYVSHEIFMTTIIVVFTAFLLLMMLLGAIIITKDKANFYVVFIFSTLILGIMLFFTFYFPIFPQLIDKCIGNLI